MREIRYGQRFIKSYKKLPRELKTKLKELEPYYNKDVFHPILRSKKLKGKLSQLYSFRLTRHYRILFSVPNLDTVEFLMIKHRKDIYK